MLPKLFRVVSSRRTFDLKRDTFYVGMPLAWLGKLKKKETKSTFYKCIYIYIFTNNHLNINTIITIN